MSLLDRFTGCFRRPTAAAAVSLLAVLAALAACSPGSAGGSAPGGAAAFAGVPVQVTGSPQARPAKAGNQAARAFTATAVRWPTAASGSVLLGAPAGGRASGPVARVAGTPVWVQALGGPRQEGARAAAAGATSVTATVLPHGQAAALGVSGVVFSLAGSAPAGDRVRVGVSYASFGQALGGNFGTRLRLVELPACALTTPDLAACRRQTPVGSVQDYRHASVSADLSLPALRGGTALTIDASSAAQASVVLAATSATGQDGGAAGAYPASKLSPAGTWSEGGDSGAFTYSYPLAVPPARGGLAPSLALGYDSQSVDGTTAVTQAQANWLGDGWSTPDSYVSLQTVPCSDDPEGTAAPYPTGDQCFDGDTVQMSLDGTTTPLVLVSSATSGGVTTSTWKAQSDNGEVITHVSPSSTVFGKYDTASPGGDYWTVTERDGTRYTFGMQHLTGWQSGDAATNSVDWMPVESTKSGDPCYNANAGKTGFAASVCDMAYEWHLDYVTDVHSDAMAYFYYQDKNYYGENNGATDVPYISNSYPLYIAYGFTDGNAYGTPADRVNFTAGSRCTASTCGALSTSNANVGTQYPDVPVDLLCASGATCTAQSPSMFSQVRLTAITAQQYSPAAAAYENADSWAFAQEEPASGDGLSPTLWLDSITRTGSDTGAGGAQAPVTLPPVTFGKIDMPNRVFTASYPGLYRYRVQSVTSELGGATQVTYETPEPCSSSYSSSSTHAVMAANTDSCYPVEWTPPGATAPVTDWFESYAVAKVVQGDTTGGSMNVVSDYSYGGGAAWHYDDNLAVQAKYRTWGQFRGYGTVTTETGQAPQALTESSVAYYRGMNGDTLPSGTASVTLTDSQGAAHPDSDQLAGDPLESTTYDGAGGPVTSSTISSYWVSPAVADMGPAQLPELTAGSPVLPDLTATVTAPAETWTRTALTDGGETGKWNVTETDDTYDATASDADFGLLTAAYSHTDPVNAAYDSCTLDQYAPPNTAKNLIGLVSYTETDKTACTDTGTSYSSAPARYNSLSAPAAVTAAQVSGAARTFYDDPSFSETFPQAAAPKYGKATMVMRASGGTPGAFTWQVKSQSVYDSYGRVTGAYDPFGRETTTSYTDNAAGETTGVQVTAPPTTYLNGTTTVTTAHASSTTLDPARGLTLTSTDQNGITATEQYDELGRPTSVWTNGRATTATANVTYAYTVSGTGLSGVVTDTLNNEGNYVPSSVIYDALGRVRQTQATGTTPTGDGRVVADTMYDSRGWAYQTSKDWYDPSSLPQAGTALAATPWSSAPNVDLLTYDGTGRLVEDTAVTNDKARDTTVTAYNGDSTTVVPGIPGIPAAGTAAVPAGTQGAGVVQTTTANPVGQTTSVADYTANPTLTIPANPATGTFSVSGGTPHAITYAYDAMGNQDSETLGGTSWTQAYDLLGQKTKTTDPAGGTTTMSYDAAGELTQTQDANGRYLSYKYDQDGRKTAEYNAPATGQVNYGSTGANETASWVYDNANGAVPSTIMTNPLGQETTAYAYTYPQGVTGGYAYKVQQKAFNAWGKSTGESFIVPSGAPGSGIFGSGLVFTSTYGTVNGQLTGQTFPAGGGLPTEGVTYNTVGALDLPSTVAGLTGYASGTSYTSLSQVENLTIGAAATGESEVAYAYDPLTGAVTDQKVTGSTGNAVDDTAYAYAPNGSLTSETDTRRGSASTAETQCFTYTTQGQLAQAWTATDACAAVPTASSQATVGDPLGSSSAYDEAWQYDALGEPVSKTAWAGGSATPSTTTYGYSATAPTELTSTTTTGATSGSTSYGYDADGNQATRDTATGSQTLTWDAQGNLTGAVVTSTGAAVAGYVYGPGGALFSQTEGTKTTVYLPGEQLTVDTSASPAALTGTRFYALPGGATAVRTGAGDAYGFEVASDQHGTNTLYLDYAAQNPAWRQYDPYGNARGPAPAAGAFPGSRGFLGDPADAGTGLTNIGARWYDPATGTFASLDPLLEKASQLQLNGYTYAGMNPVTGSDPTGLHICWGDQGCNPPPPGAIPGPDGRCGCGNGTTTGSGTGNDGGGTLPGSTPQLPAGWSYQKTGLFSGVVTHTWVQRQCSGGARTGSPWCWWQTDHQQFNVGTVCTGPRAALPRCYPASDFLTPGQGRDVFLTIMLASGSAGLSAILGGMAADEGATSLAPTGVRLSQSSVNGAAKIIDSMRANGWVGDPIDVVRMPDGGLTTIDNTRVVAANQAGIDVQAMIHGFDDPLPPEFIERFTTPKGGVPSTWGDAILNRIGAQNSLYRNTYPFGSPFTGWVGN